MHKQPRRSPRILAQNSCISDSNLYRDDSNIYHDGFFGSAFSQPGCDSSHRCQHRSPLPILTSCTIGGISQNDRRHCGARQRDSSRWLATGRAQFEAEQRRGVTSGSIGTGASMVGMVFRAAWHCSRGCVCKTFCCTVHCWFVDECACSLHCCMYARQMIHAQ